MRLVHLLFCVVSVSILFASCSARAVRVEARAVPVATDPEQVFIEATILDGEDVVRAPKVVMLRDQEAAAFVGEAKNGAVINGYSLRFHCVGREALIVLEHHRDGALVETWRGSVPIRSESK